MASVSYCNVNKVFQDGSQALADFSLDIANGELMVLVGPSGCGKSTLLRLLAGLETASAGELRIDGRRVDELPPQRRNVAMVFQNYALYPHMTVADNLDFPLRMLGWPRDRRRQRVAETAELLDLAPLLARKPGQLSGGQRQRVAMGRALVREPQVFLLDEPLSNLDARLRVRLRGEIAALQRRLGTTMIYVTHDQSEAMTLGHRVAVLDHGRLQQVAPPGEIYRQPANVFVAGFMGQPGMNLFAAELAAAPDGGLELHWGARRLALPCTGERRAALAPYLGRSLQAGLRPEAFMPPGSGAGQARVRGRVAAVEILGHEQLVHFRAEADRPAGLGAADEAGREACLVARLPTGFKAEIGHEVELAADLAQLHLFDARGVALAGASPNVP